jgi:uncharacterized membrane protein YeaQ/YmgE (transglycosylase-associated protein family)
LTSSLGVIGAVVSGYLFTAIGATGLTGSNLYSMFVAIIGAVVVLWLYHARGSSVSSGDVGGCHGEQAEFYA